MEKNEIYRIYGTDYQDMTRQLLQEYRFPDETFDWERRYLMAASTLMAAEQALSDGKGLYARQLLEEMEAFPELERKKLLLLGRIPGADLPAVSRQLPSLDGELLLRAEAALADGNTDRAAALLEAAENREDSRWNLLRGKVFLARKQYAAAAECLQKAEAAYPADCASALEACFRELGNFEKAYFYACKQR